MSPLKSRVGIGFQAESIGEIKTVTPMLSPLSLVRTSQLLLTAIYNRFSWRMRSVFKDKIRMAWEIAVALLTFS